MEVLAYLRQGRRLEFTSEQVSTGVLSRYVLLPGMVGFLLHVDCAVYVGWCTSAGTSIHPSGQLWKLSLPVLRVCTLLYTFIMTMSRPRW